MFDHTDTAPPAEKIEPFEPPKRRTAWSAADLMAEVFPEPKWAVPGMICEGLSLLCGPPKVGKSWASLALGLAVASGGKAFGALDVDQGEVLYLALEDTARRLQARMRTVLAGASAPDGLTIVTECPRLDRGGAEAIDGWLTDHPRARLVVVDVFAKVRPAPAPGIGAYEADYAAVGAIKRLADKHAVAVLVVHHVRKAGSEDFLAEVSGTNGIAGAADATLVLKRARGQADGILHITGRDVEEIEHALSFNPANGTWQLLNGDPRQLTATDNQSTVVAWLRTHPGSGPKAIAEGTGLPENSVKTVLKRSSLDGWITQTRRGQWEVAEDGTEAEELW
ncbi:AAA family ATPase [Glycomyces tenuis]|uniref:AAA family ATPase n=1 Tax=Glycomyces tenuis TaxID=58116 RepID=UPI00041A00F9|nr:AAA family ATPase [Glycomyces tenuis]